jgi:flavin-dependent dehydrogenase
VEVCVIGAGPAGASIAVRLAALGHTTVLVERSRFPRAHVGEALTPGVLPQLELLGARGRVEAAGFLQARASIVCWRDDDLPVPRRAHAPGLVVDRGRFDAILVDVAARAGAAVLQPAVVRRVERDGRAWRVDMATPTGAVAVHARFLVDATGRSGFLGGRRSCVAPATVALRACFARLPLPAMQHVEAGPEAWCWASPRPDGTFSVMAFADARAFADLARTGGAVAAFARYLEASRLLRACADVAPLARVQVCDATPRVAGEPGGDDHLRVGDAAFTLDPLSSTGVEKAIQMALAGAAAVHTILARPRDAALARAFYRERHHASVAEHATRAAAHYREPQRYAGHPFWQARGLTAARPPPEPPRGPRSAPPRSLAEPMAVSVDAALIGTPCIVGDFIESRRALHHPRLSGPVAFVGGIELASLLDHVAGGGTLLDALRALPASVPTAERLRTAAWLFENGILTSPRPAAHGGG